MSVKNTEKVIEALREELAQAIIDNDLESTINALKQINELNEQEKIHLLEEPTKSHDTLLHIAADCGNDYITSYVLQMMLLSVPAMPRLNFFENKDKLGETAMEVAASANYPSIAQLIDACFIKTEKEVLRQLEIQRWQSFAEQRQGNSTLSR